MSSRRPTRLAGGLTIVVLFASALGLLVLASPSAASPAARKARSAVADRAAPTLPRALRVTAAGPSSISVAWARSSDNVRVKGYGVYRGSTRVDSTPFTTYTFGRLACGTSQVLGVDAFDAAGNRSGRAAIVAATAPCRDLVAPSAPGGLRPVASTADSVTVSWTPVRDDALGGYGLYQGALQVGVTQTTSFTFSRLGCGSTHQIGVDAYDVVGNRSAVTQIYVVTAPCPDSQPPTAPGTVSVSGVTKTGLTLTWGASADNVRVVAYEVAIGSARVRTTSTRYDVTGLACGSSYALAVAALDDAGNRSAETKANAATTPCGGGVPGGADPPPTPAPDSSPPSAPSALAVGAATGTSVVLSWQPSSDNRGVTGYGVYRDGRLVATVAGTAYTFAGLACGSSSELGVDALDAAGNRSGVTRVLAATAACLDTTPPVAPVDLLVTGRTQNSIALGWNHGANATDVVGYRLYRDGAKVGETASAFSWTFADLTCNKSYSLGVASVDAAGNASTQAVTLAVTLPCPDTTAPAAPTGLSASGVTQTTATISWSGQADVATYALSVNGSSVGTSNQASYSFPALACGTAYTFGVEALDAAGNRSARSTLSVTTAACATTPPPPPAPPPAPGGSGGQVTLSPTGNDATCVRGDASKPCKKFQRAYDIAQSGDTIVATPGTYTVDDPGRDSITVFGDDKPVTFTCTGPARSVEGGPLLTIKADNVTVRGSCFKLRYLRIGEGGDPRGIKNALIEDVKLDALEVVGAEATIRRVEIGPNMSCFPAGDTSVPATARCNPNSPWESERYWAAKGSLPGFQPYLHNNAAGVNAKVLMDQVWIHDLQTRDANLAHTGCMLIWNTPADTSPNQIVIRNSRLERCAVLGILVDGGHGITLEGNYFGPPVEPLDNVGWDYSKSAVEAGDFAREFGVNVDPINGAPQSVQNYRVVGNTFTHGTLMSPGNSYANWLFDGNDLGRANVCVRGTNILYGKNSGTDACGSQPLAAPPAVPAAGG